MNAGEAGYNLCLTRRAWRAAQVVLIVLVLTGAAWPANVPALAGDVPAAAPSPGQTPLAELLDEQGRLDLTSGFRGSIDGRGWRLVSGPHEEPAFASLDSEEGYRWSDIFYVPGTDRSVYVMAMDGAGTLYIGGAFTTAGGVAANYIARWDGNNWSGLGSGMGGYDYARVEALAVDGAGNLYAGGSFTSAGGVAANNVAKWNGSTWSALGSGVGGLDYSCVYALAVNDAGNLYAGGEFTTAGGLAANYVAKWDGSAWSALDSGMSGTYTHVLALAADGAGNVFAGGRFTTAGGVAANNIARWNGSTWSALGSGIGGTDNPSVQTLAVDGAGSLYAGGSFSTAGGTTANNIAKWNGSAWSALGSGVGSGTCGYTAGVDTLAVDGAGNLFAGGNFADAGGAAANNIAKWGGGTWSALGSGMPVGTCESRNVLALAVDDTGNLFAGGNFTFAGDVAANNIATWDGSAWFTVGGGHGLVGDEHYTSELLTALAADGAGKLYAGGWFSFAGGVAANHIAKWDGTKWSALSSGTDGYVHALAADGAGNVYVGGGFTTVGGVAANHIARWDGTAWSALGSGMGGEYLNVQALVVDGAGHLYAGGSFSTAGDVTANRIAKWDGSAWSALGSGMNGNVYALAVDGAGTLYAGGYFTSASGVAANYVAKWDGSTWHALGTGMGGSSPHVDALAVDDAGNLYAGGWFTSAGGVAVYCIAKWNGSAWSAVGSGMDGYGVNALAVDGAGHLYAGGAFWTAGGVAANHVARWDGSTWSALGDGIGGTSQSVNALAVDGAGNLYAGGGFTTAGGKLSANIGRWEPAHELTLAMIGNGSGTVTSRPMGIDCGAACLADFTPGTVVTLTATAGAFSTFSGWSGACAGMGTCVVTMNTDKAVSATFTLQTFPLTVSKAGIGSGTVTSSPPGIDCGAACSAYFSAGTVVTLTATAGALSTFTGWSVACADAGPCVVTMDASKAVTATFAAPGAVTPQASTMYYGQQLQVGGVVAAAPAAVTKLVVFTGTVPAGIFLVGVEGSAPYAGEVSVGRLINRLLAEGCGTHGACSAVNCTVYAPDGAHSDFVVTSPVTTDHLFLPHVRR